jgi:outer membrane protein, multidrug efflux system
MNRPLILTFATLALAACTVGPDFQAPQIVTPEVYTQAPEAPPGLEPVDLARWWTTFDDPVLSSLIERAVQANLDLRVAAARVREARAQRGVVAAQDVPQVDTFSSVGRTRVSESIGGAAGGFPGDTSELYEVGFDASWELDVFGRVRRDVESADADIAAREYDLRNTLVTLISETARNYVELRSFQRRLEITQKNIGTQADTRDLSRSLFEAGLTSEFDVARSESLLSLTTAQVPALETGVEQAIHRLSVLLGAFPGALRDELIAPAPIPQGPASIPLAAPADLLLRRPDLRAAERELASATAQIGVATADLYPRISLLGSLGLSAEEFENLFRSGSTFWSIGPRISWPLFEGGRIRANIAVQNARTEQALYTYEQAVLTSLREVEDAIVGHAKEQVRLRTLQDAVASDQRAVDLVDELFRGGLEDFLDVLDSQRSLFASEDELVQSEAQVALNLIALYKALGGGWEPMEAAEDIPASPGVESTLQ